MLPAGALVNTVFIMMAAFVLAVGATPLARRLALRFQFLDRPALRNDHTQPMPLLGGLAIYAAVIGSLVLFNDRQEIVEVASILIGATWVSFVGIWDDRSALGVGAKLVGQLIALGLLLAGGLQVFWHLPIWINLPVTAIWVLGITNAFNLLDNMDGLSGGIGAVAAGSFVVLAALNGQYGVAVLAAALAGGCLGFLIYNFNPARIFMGDSGSLFLGFLLAACGIRLTFPQNVPWVTWMVPILVMGIPILDTALVVVSRLRRGLNPLATPGKDHLSHRLCALGLSRRQAVLVLYLAAVALGAAAVVVSLSEPLTAYVLAALIGVAGVAILAWLEIQRARRPAVRSMLAGPR